MQKTENYGLNKPDVTDFYDVNDFNNNMDVIDAKMKEVEDKAAPEILQSHMENTENPHEVTKSQVGLSEVPNVSTNNQTPTYTVPSDNAELVSGEKLSTAFGKIAKAIKSLISHLADSVSHITATERSTWNAKQSAISGGASTITSSNLTASRALISNSSGKVAVSAVTSTELGYLDGVTSNVQTQLNAKQASISGGASTIASSNLTANRALISNSSGKVAVSAVTSTELGYLDGVTSAIQTQLNGKAASNATPSITRSGNKSSYRFPSGLQIETNRIAFENISCTTSWGADLYESSALSLGSWLQSFAGNPIVSVRVLYQSGYHAGLIECATPATTTSAGSVYICVPNSTTGRNFYVEVMAIGSWA